MTNVCIQERAVPVREDPPGLRQLAACVPGVQQEVHIQTEAHYAHQVLNCILSVTPLLFCNHGRVGFSQFSAIWLA